MEFYQVHTTTIHNNHCIGTTTGLQLLANQPQDTILCLDWDNVSQEYQRAGGTWQFNIWHFKKGRIISFFTSGFYLRKDERDIKEWKQPHLNIRIETTYKKYIPSLQEVLQWHDGEQALQYLMEKSVLSTDLIAALINTNNY